MNRRTGKIARMARADQVQVNVMLRDGSTYPEIIAWLKANGHGDFNAENISNWFEGGYCDWEREQKRIEEMRERSRQSLELVRALKAESGPDGPGIHITEANELLVASQVNEVLQDINVADIKAMLQLAPENYPKLAKIVTAQSNERTKRQALEFEFQKYREKVEAQRRTIENELAKVKEGGLAPETITKIEEALNLL